MNNKFKYYFFLWATPLFLFSCSKSDTSERDYSVQYTADITTIEQYLKSHYITVTDHPGFSDDQDVVFTPIPAGVTKTSIWDYLNSNTFPKLLSRDVSFKGITYKLYYLILREGKGESPTNVDSVLTSYRGDYLTQTGGVVTATKFEEIKYPEDFLNLNNTIVGWSEIFPQFKKGTHVPNSNGTITYSDFGAGVMFIPSGLAYYASVKGTIPAYSPLVFSFKLYEIKRLDQDNDGIPSYLEDLNKDRYVYDFRNKVNYPTPPATNPDDTDGDNLPDFYDVDDDGDNYTTKLERSYKGTNGLTLYYDFDSIPDCKGSKSDKNRLKKYLDSNCH